MKLIRALLAYLQPKPEPTKLYITTIQATWLKTGEIK